jgi:subtilase family serine protease
VSLAAEALEIRSLLSTTTPATDLTTITVQPAVQSSAQPDAGSTVPAGAFTPAQIRTAYGFNAISATGAGQTIAIIEAFNDPTLASDLNTFDSQFGLTTSGRSLASLFGSSSSFLTQVSQTGSTSALPSTDAGWALETSLDVEWAHAIAPAAKILVVEANSSNLSDLLGAVNFARNQSAVSVVSMSWGSSEIRGETAYDSFFTTPAGHAGITFVASSGDDGGGQGPDWPAVSPNVVSVGGTSLTINSSSNTYTSETAWLNSGGGISRYEPEPAYQRRAQSTGARTTPDVAYNANPSNGYAVYDSTAFQGQSGWFQVGGTSAGAPQVASMMALIDQSLSRGSLDGASQTLPIFYGVAASSASSFYFHDVTTGNSFRWLATPGYDGVTGLGSPIANAWVQAAVGNAGMVATTSVTPTVHAVVQTAKPQVTTTTTPTTTTTVAAVQTPVVATQQTIVSITTTQSAPVALPSFVASTNQVAPLVPPSQVTPGQSLLFFPVSDQAETSARIEREPEAVPPVEWTINIQQPVTLPAEEPQDMDMSTPGRLSKSPAYWRALESVDAIFAAHDSDLLVPANPQTPAVDSTMEEEEATAAEAALSAALAVAVWGVWQWRSTRPASSSDRRWLSVVAAGE